MSSSKPQDDGTVVESFVPARTKQRESSSSEAKHLQQQQQHSSVALSAPSAINSVVVDTSNINKKSQQQKSGTTISTSASNSNLSPVTVIPQNNAKSSSSVSSVVNNNNNNNNNNGTRIIRKVTLMSEDEEIAEEERIKELILSSIKNEQDVGTATILSRQQLVQPNTSGIASFSPQITLVSSGRNSSTTIGEINNNNNSPNKRRDKKSPGEDENKKKFTGTTMAMMDQDGFPVTSTEIRLATSRKVENFTYFVKSCGSLASTLLSSSSSSKMKISDANSEKNPGENNTHPYLEKLQKELFPVLALALEEVMSDPQIRIEALGDVGKRIGASSGGVSETNNEATNDQRTPLTHNHNVNLNKSQIQTQKKQNSFQKGIGNNPSSSFRTMKGENQSQLKQQNNNNTSKSLAASVSVDEYMPELSGSSTMPKRSASGKNLLSLLNNAAIDAGASSKSNKVVIPIAVLNAAAANAQQLQLNFNTTINPGGTNDSPTASTQNVFATNNSRFGNANGNNVISNNLSASTSSCQNNNNNNATTSSSVSRTLQRKNSMVTNAAIPRHGTIGGSNSYSRAGSTETTPRSVISAFSHHQQFQTPPLSDEEMIFLLEKKNARKQELVNHRWFVSKKLATEMRRFKQEIDEVKK